jgi:hypothetical protein
LVVELNDTWHFTGEGPTEVVDVAPQPMTVAASAAIAPTKKQNASNRFVRRATPPFRDET